MRNNPNRVVIGFSKKNGAWLGIGFIIFLLSLTGFTSSIQAKERSTKVFKEFKKNSKEVNTPKELLPVRKPRGAGSFYPGNEEDLYRLVDDLFTRGTPLNLPGVRAVLVPHAGYVYSGEVAAAAMRELQKGFTRVFILAANHSGEANFSGVSLPEFRSYAIPGAEIPLSPLVAELRKEPLFTSAPQSHEAYMIEVELPFLYSHAGRTEKPSFSIVPMIVGRLNQEKVHQLASTLKKYADDKTAFVFSVDLSHFYPDDKARQLDFASIDAVLSRNLQGLEKDSAGGHQNPRDPGRLVVFCRDFSELTELIFAEGLSEPTDVGNSFHGLRILANRHERVNAPTNENRQSLLIQPSEAPVSKPSVNRILSVEARVARNM